MLKLNYVAMCQERKAQEKKVNRKARHTKETIKGFIALGCFLVVAGVVGRMDYETEVVEVSAKETKVESLSTVRRVYGITMDNGNTLYTIEPDGNVYSWYDEDASEMEDYSSIQLIYDTLGTTEMDDDEIITVVPTEPNSDTKAVLEYVFEGGEQ